MTQDVPTPPLASTAAQAPAAVPPAGVTPRRPGLDPATRRQTFVVAAVIAALFYGSQVLNEAIPANAAGQTQPGAAAAIGDGVSITPLEGWVATPHENSEGIRLEKGIVVIDLYPESLGGNAAALASAYLANVLEPDATQLTSTEAQTATTADGTAARFSYQGLFSGIDVAIEGEVTAVVVGGQGVIADAWSRQGDLVSLLDEVHAMVETIEVGS